jgi:hypothetical protein
MYILVTRGSREAPAQGTSGHALLARASTLEVGGRTGSCSSRHRGSPGGVRGGHWALECRGHAQRERERERERERSKSHDAVHASKRAPLGRKQRSSRTLESHGKRPNLRVCIFVVTDPQTTRIHSFSTSRAMHRGGRGPGVRLCGCAGARTRCRAQFYGDAISELPVTVGV